MANINKIPESVIAFNDGRLPSSLTEWKQVAFRLGRIVDDLARSGVLRGSLAYETERARWMIQRSEDLRRASERRGRGAPADLDEIVITRIVTHVESEIKQLKGRNKQALAILNVLKRFAPPGTAKYKLREMVSSLKRQIRSWKRLVRRWKEAYLAGSAPDISGESVQPDLESSEGVDTSYMDTRISEYIRTVLTRPVKRGRKRN